MSMNVCDCADLHKNLCEWWQYLTEFSAWMCVSVHNDVSVWVTVCVLDCSMIGSR